MRARVFHLNYVEKSYLTILVDFKSQTYFLQSMVSRQVDSDKVADLELRGLLCRRSRKRSSFYKKNLQKSIEPFNLIGLANLGTSNILLARLNFTQNAKFFKFPCNLSSTYQNSYELSFAEVLFESIQVYTLPNYLNILSKISYFTIS